jgi:peptidoglycan/xylan/chitin deacetylase (PgdA/CDA1 family)
MANGSRREDRDPTGAREQRIARREQRRRQIRRRRLVAVGSLLLIVAAVVVVVTTVAGSAGGGSAKTAAKTAAKGANGGGGGKGAKAGGGSGEASTSGKVRNATPQPGWKPYTGPVPILEYHVLGQPDAEAPYPELYVGRTDFSRQMDWLDEQGYEAVTLEQVEDAWYHGGTLPQKPVVVSFDDGYRPQYTFALPELRKHGWPGVLNLKAEGSDLYESNVKAMIAAGWELAAHTIDHADLTTLEGAALEEEVAGSRRILQREYGVPVKNFCYPAGQFDETVIAAVEAAGYVGATTEIPGFASREAPYELARIEVLGDLGVSGLAEAMRSGAEEAGV